MEQNTAANDTPVQVKVDPWRVERLGDAQLSMRSVLHGLMEAPFTGVDLADGELEVGALADAEAACKHFERALVDELRRMGVNVRKLSQGATPEEVNVTDMDGLVLCKWEDEPALTSMYMETVAIAGSCSGNVLELAGKVGAGIVEAVAEMLRVLLSGAIIASFRDGAEESDVVVILHAGPEIASRVRMGDGGVSALTRMRGVVYDRREDGARSYLLGESVARIKNGAKNPLQFVWAFPLVEQVYGPSRLRWKDKRSAPSYVSAEKPKLVVAS